MKNHQTPPCYDRKNHTDCPRRSADCRWHCKAWKEYEDARNADYNTVDYEYEDRKWRYEKGQRRKLKRMQEKERWGS